MDKNFFIKQQFHKEEVEKYKQSALKSLNIAIENAEDEVRFHFAFMALIKLGIYCLAANGFRIKSRPGHHQKIIEYLSSHLKNNDVLVMGEKMRRDRNLDFYSAQEHYSQEEVNEYIEFIKKLYAKTLKGKAS